MTAKEGSIVHVGILQRQSQVDGWEYREVFMGQTSNIYRKVTSGMNEGDEK